MSSLFAGPSGARDHETRVQELFGRLRSICVPLSSRTELHPETTANTTTLLIALADELDSIPQDLKPLRNSLVSYVFFPIATLLQRNELAAIPDRTLEAVMRVFASVAEHLWWSASAQEWEQLFKLLTFVLAGASAKANAAALDEHTQLAVVHALHAVLGGRTQSAERAERVEIYRGHAHVYVVSKTLDTLLGLCASRNIDLALASLRTTSLLVRDFMPEDLAPSVMPGVVSKMATCALGGGSSKGWANGDAVAAALDVLSSMAIAAIGDDVCVAAGAIKRVENLEDLASLVSDAVQETAQAEKGLMRRTPSWVTGAATQLHIVLNSLTPLLAHSNATALRGIVSLSAILLRGTMLTVPQSQPLLLSFLLALCRSDFASVSSAAHVALVEAARQPAALQNLLDLARDALAQLSRLIRSRSHTRLAHRLRQVLAVCSLADDVPSVHVGIGRVLGQGGGIEKWGLGLLTALDFALPVQATIVPDAALLLEDSTHADDDLAFPPLTLKSPADADVQALLEDTFRALGHAGSLECLYAVEWLVTLGVRERSARASSALWCAALIAEGVSLAGPRDAQSTSKLFKTARWMAKEAAELWQIREEDEMVDEDGARDEPEEDRPQIEFVKGLIKVETTAAFPTPRSAPSGVPSWSPDVHRAAALRVIAASSSALQAAFAPLLLYTLYPVLHSLVSPSALQRSTAMAALSRIARTSGFATPQNLLMANFDYALAGAAARLLRAQLDVDAAKVLRILVRLVGGDVVDKMGDVVAECFERLDDYHGYEVLVERLVEVLGEVVRVVREDVDAREPVHLPEEAPPEVRLDMFKGQTVDQLLDWLGKRSEQPPPVAEDEDFGPAPREDWGARRRDHDHDHEHEENGAHDDGHPAPAVPEPEKPQPTATHKLVHLILSRAIPFLTHASSLVRARILGLLASAVPILAHDASEDDPGRALLLPQIHRAWPFVLNRLEDPEPYVAAAAAGLVAALAAAAGTGAFVRARVWDDVWPRFKTILDALQRAEAESALTQRRAGGNAPSTYATSTRLHVAMLRTLDAALRGPGGAPDNAAWEVAVAFRRFLDAAEEDGVQRTAVRVFMALKLANEDAVWLVLCGSAGAVLGGTGDSAPDASPVEFPSCLRRKWNITQNAQAILA